MAETDEQRKDRRLRRKERKTAKQAAAGPITLNAAEWLGDIDAWNLRIDGDWLRFDARLGDHPRGYLRPVAGGDIIADAPGPLLAILGLGGPRAAGFNAGPSTFAQNVLAPADHIGAVGCEGTAKASRTAGLQRIPHRPREALCAETLLGWRYLARRGMPLIMVRTETDTARSVVELGQGPAFQNLLTALDNLGDAARSLNRPARVLAVTITYGAEDLESDVVGFVTGFRDLMARIEAAMMARGLVPPVFLATPETGTPLIASHPAIRAFHDLAGHPGPHRLILPAPGHCFAQDGFGRLTEVGRQDMARMDAHALAAVERGEDWFCPVPLLAEAEGTEVRVTFRSMAPLIIDEAPPFAVGPAAGFAISGGRVLDARIAADDPMAILLTVDAPPGTDAVLLHGCDAADGAGGGPNRSAVRDTWQAPGVGGTLHRWALSAALPIGRGGYDL